jgi:type III pantothenate kinase
LGADRWVALIGARKAHPGRALCIVNIGTAMTIDLIDVAGRHRGGSITPGPTMMQAALLTNTAGIRRSARGARPGKLTLFASNTRAALSGGATFACAALIERASDEARTLLGSRPILILDGGAAAIVAPLLRLRALRQDDLVLRGLAVFAAAAKDIA